jgi:hypothetical protein
VSYSRGVEITIRGGLLSEREERLEEPRPKRFG